MKAIIALQNIYGKTYGALVFAACLFFALAGTVWFARMLFWFRQFNTSAFALMLVFGTLLVYHKKLAALISGIVTLFFSLFLFVGLAANRASLPGIFGVGVVLALLAIVSSGILIFGFLQAFKHSEDL